MGGGQGGGVDTPTVARVVALSVVKIVLAGGIAAFSFRQLVSQK